MQLYVIFILSCMVSSTECAKKFKTKDDVIVKVESGESSFKDVEIDTSLMEKPRKVLHTSVKSFCECCNFILMAH